MGSVRDRAVLTSTISTSMRNCASPTSSRSWTVGTSVSTSAFCPCASEGLMAVCPAMVKNDNKVALRQLELANAALLSSTALRSYPGKSIAKDGKFHPRVLTLVRQTAASCCATSYEVLCRVVTTQSLFRFCAALPPSTDPLGAFTEPHCVRLIRPHSSSQCYPFRQPPR